MLATMSPSPWKESMPDPTASNDRPATTLQVFRPGRNTI